MNNGQEGWSNEGGNAVFLLKTLSYKLHPGRYSVRT